MKVTLESTTKIVALVINGVEVEARVWEGRTSSGIACHAYITRIAVHREDDASEFDRELKQMRDPVNPDVAAMPRRIVI
jgi:hypothetical protein